MDGEITCEEITECLKKVKNDKAAGIDGIPYEFYKNGGEWMIERLYELFKEIWKEEKVPAKWNESRVILIHEGGHKSKKELRNYRPIALGDTVGKLFCRILNERLKTCVENGGVMGEEQNGFRSDRRGEDNMFVLNQMIEYKVRVGGRLYCAFLDIEKAYDRVDRNILCKVLEKIGLSEKWVKVIRSMYENTRAKYSLGDTESDWVRSVRQGCILCPLLFGLYTEELAVRVKRTGLGVRVGNEKLSLLLYADDVVILSENAEDLQKMLNEVTGYGRDFRVKFSYEKSQVLVVNGQVEDEGKTWQLGDQVIQRVSEYKYLGVWLNEKGCEKAKAEIIRKARQWYGRLSSVSRFRANGYEIMRGLWKGMAVPGIMYGMNVMTWTNSEIDKLDVIQNRVGRVALGANRYVGVEAIRGDMGWSTFDERWMKAMIQYRVRLSKMQYDRWARKVYYLFDRESKWDRGCRKRMRKVGMREGYSIRVEVGWRMVWVDNRGSEWGWEWDEKKWKKVINEKVQELGLQKWRVGMEGKSTLEWYACKETPRYENWYDGGWGPTTFQSKNDVA